MKIILEKFEGPLDLLLKLIEKEEMDITKISLAAIADQYVEFVKKSTQISPGDVADFLFIAARLLYIKSRALLPFLQQDEEEEEDLEEFEKQLKIYKEYLEAAKSVEDILATQRFMFVREFNKKAILNNTNSFSPPKDLKMIDLKNTFEELLARIKPVKKLTEEVLEYKVSIEERIANIQKMFLNKVKTSFDKLIENCSSKADVVVSFLAVLELMRQRELVLDQEDLFGEITISRVVN
ncbi:segregation/condensation protein A [Candidatus Parcubacteria bacterium]|nr:segregation/condensation protein A [Patescibacteria group bacterium]MBU4309354.1 segregation/condensation protein A [Patescibacteria group bacterium]MBU4431850.1 segregation/condensation protein A [Patescibacteria group bacterium]MBU4577715.1 segregation/condensation protein A [Patescibacteria group bacterium]MCG2697401.1 segregation/condensation protein A [Candidatus Parcubacteria bacterium]